LRVNWESLWFGQSVDVGFLYFLLCLGHLDIVALFISCHFVILLFVRDLARSFAWWWSVIQLHVLSSMCSFGSSTKFNFTAFSLVACVVTFDQVFKYEILLHCIQSCRMCCDLWPGFPGGFSKCLNMAWLDLMFGIPRNSKK
jgi:hypothetical protein